MPHCDELRELVASNYEVHEFRHACSILKNDFPNEWNDVVAALAAFKLRHSHFTVGGGGRSKVAITLEAPLAAAGWVEKKWDTAILVDGVPRSSPTHKVDRFKNGIALEVEWNNKTEFYDRDLNNFRLLFDLRVVSVGIIITRADELDELFAGLSIRSKYGPSTTILSKLLPRIHGGGGGGCPILAFGIRKSLYDPKS
jgi:hypothetical protein